MRRTTYFVRRQSFLGRRQLKIRESLARLVCDVLRLVFGAAIGNCLFEVARQVVALKQDPVLERALPGA
jgi:hypothetical protein